MCMCDLFIKHNFQIQVTLFLPIFFYIAFHFVLVDFFLEFHFVNNTVCLFIRL